MCYAIQWCCWQIRRINSLFFSEAQYTSNTRMRILNIVDRIFLRLLLGEGYVEFKMRAHGTHIEEEFRCIGADIVDQLVKQIITAAALAKLDQLAFGDKRYHLVDDNLDFIR